MMEEVSNWTSRVAEYVAARSVPPAFVFERAKLVCLDTIGAMIVGTQLRPGSTMLRYAAESSGQTQATVVGDKRRTLATQATFANAVLAHSDEVDETHFASMTHPGCVTVPVGLAGAEVNDASGRDFLIALITGYDIECRVSFALDPRQLLTRGFQAMAVCGYFGAAATAGSVLGLAADQVRDALGIAGTFAGGLWASATDGTHMTRALVAGVPARAGLEAGLLVRSGFNGPEAIFEGRSGFLAAFSNSPRHDLLLDKLGESFEIVNSSTKKHACGQPIQNPVDGLLALMDAHSLTAGDIELIRIKMARSAADIVMRRTEGAISIDRVLAVAAIDRVVGIRQTHTDRIGDSDVSELSKRVSIVPDERFEARWPAQRSTEVELALTNGQTLSKTIEWEKGTAENPLTSDEMIAKFTSLTGQYIDEGRIDRIVDRVMNIEAASSVSDLMKELSGPIGRSSCDQ